MSEFLRNKGFILFVQELDYKPAGDADQTAAGMHHSKTAVNSDDVVDVAPTRSRHASSVRQPRSRHTSTRSVIVVEERKPFDRQVCNNELSFGELKEIMINS